MEKVDLSIIIPSFNTRNLLENCLASIQHSCLRFSFEVIVVDNGSTDGSCDMVRKKFPTIILIENVQNLGFGKANNQGAKKAKGEFLLFLNSDTLVLKDAIERMVNFAKKKVNSVIGGKLLNQDYTPQPSCGPFFSLTVVFKMLFLKGDLFGFTRFSPNKTQNVGWVSGACLLVKKSIFDKIRGFDEKIFMYMEEVELLERLSKQGIKTIFYPDALFIHVGGGSSSGRKDPVRNIYTGLQYLYQKNHSKNELIILQIMLKLKAIIAIGIGTLLQKKELIQTYNKAYASID